MIVSSARACDSLSRRSALGLSLRPKIDSGNRLRRAILPSVGGLPMQFRHGAYHRVGLANPPAVLRRSDLRCGQRQDDRQAVIAWRIKGPVVYRLKIECSRVAGGCGAVEEA